MFTKIALGGLAAAVAALGIVFMLLMDAKEANGALVSDISRVEAANRQQKGAMDFLTLRTEQLLAQVERERNNALRANEALLASEVDREQAETDFQDRLRIAKENLSDEEIICAGELVPMVFIGSMRSD